MHVYTLVSLLVAMEIYCASVVDECKRQLVAAGYSELRLKDSWDVKKGGKVSIIWSWVSIIWSW